MPAVLLLLSLALQDGVINEADEQHVPHGQIAAAVHQPAALAHAQAIDASQGGVALLYRVAGAEPSLLDELPGPCAKDQVPARGEDAAAAAARHHRFVANRDQLELTAQPADIAELESAPA